MAQGGRHLARYRFVGSWPVILLVDNYDSFVYNLRRYLQRLGQEVVVVRNDAVDYQTIESGQFQSIVLSPGPKSPAEAGCCVELVRRYARRVPILGVCLGHQAICEALGANIVRAPRPVHGRTSLIVHDGSRLFSGLPNPFPAARYHSLVADRATIPPELRVTATTESGVVMAVESTGSLTFGVQFHPESILSSCGYRILANFLTCAGTNVPQPLPQSDLALDPQISERWSKCESSETFANEGEHLIDNPCVPVVLPDATWRGES